MPGSGIRIFSRFFPTQSSLLYFQRSQGAVAGAGGHGNNVGNAAAAVVLPRTGDWSTEAGRQERWPPEVGARGSDRTNWSPDIKSG